MFKNLIIGVAIFGLGWGASFGAGAAWGRRSVASPVQAQVIPAGQLGAGAAAGAPPLPVVERQGPGPRGPYASPPRGRSSAWKDRPSSSPGPTGRPAGSP